MLRFFLLFISLTPGLFATGAAGGFDIMQFVPILLIFVIFYFLILRPQQKKAKTHQEMLKSLQRGDKVLTAGGMFGTVDKTISETETSIEIADGVKIKVLKTAITDVVTRTSVKNSTSSDVKEESKAVEKKETKAKAAPKKTTAANSKKTK